MAEVKYVVCDGCGLVDTNSREESWRRMNISRWAEVHVYDVAESCIETRDYCRECYEKMLKAVE